ncbi:MAG: DoxX family protein [Candidatus Dormiibacterota bacterium]
MAIIVIWWAADKCEDFAVNILLWALQILLALAFFTAGSMKLTQPRPRLITRMNWVEAVPQPAVRTIGSLEVVGAVGLILPAALGIAVILTPVAAVGLGLIMVGAATFHTRRHEPSGIATNAVLLALAVVIAWGRFGPYHF